MNGGLCVRGDRMSRSGAARGGEGLDTNWDWGWGVGVLGLGLGMLGAVSSRGKGRKRRRRRKGITDWLGCCPEGRGEVGRVGGYNELCCATDTSVKQNSLYTQFGVL